MRFGITLLAFADFSDPRALAELAHEAESVGFGWSWEEPWNPKASEQMRERILQGPPRQ